MIKQYLQGIYLLVTVTDHCSMEISDIRRKNLRLLMTSRFEGKQARIADALGKSANYISRCLANPDSSGAKKIGEDFAREIEETLALPRYAMDQPGLTIKEPAIESNAELIGTFDVWDDDTPLEDDLPNFPGSQMLMIIPAQDANDQKRPRGQT